MKQRAFEWVIADYRTPEKLRLDRECPGEQPQFLAEHNTRPSIFLINMSFGRPFPRTARSLVPPVEESMVHR
jgi:hypothetical protein